MAVLRGCWAADLQYDNRIRSIEERGVTVVFRLLVALCAFLLGCVPLLVSVSGETLGPPYLAVEGVASVAAFAWAVRWAFGRIPSERVSIAFVVIADLAIVVSSLCDANRLAGAMGLVNLSMLAAYAAFFHSQRVVLLQVVISLAATAVFVPLLWMSYGWVMALIKSTILILVTACAPVAIQVGVWILGEDAAASELDALTGVYNRRGFFSRAQRELRAAVGGDVVVLVVDIDHFKLINDLHGHAVGDRVLAACAKRVSEALGPAAVVGRVGGEEFAVVDIRPIGGGEAIGEIARAAVASGGAESGPAITASVGVARAPVVSIRDGGVEAIEVLVDRADRAMYAAKRRGRNATVVASVARHRRSDGADAGPHTGPIGAVAPRDGDGPNRASSVCAGPVRIGTDAASRNDRTVPGPTR
ncbi:GGDEF domain-containing protein [Tsukamurella soli]